MVSRGYQLLSDYAGQTGIPVEHTGALLVAWDAEQLDALPTLKAKAEANGYPHCEIVDAPTVYRQVPDLGDGALGGADRARRVHHLHLDHQPGPGHGHREPRPPLSAEPRGPQHRGWRTPPPPCTPAQAQWRHGGS